MTAQTLDSRIARPALERRPRPVEPLRWAVAGTLLAGVLVAVWFHLTGGTWFVVETPSMGTTAPVGTLLVDQPIAMKDVRIGDLITFRPPTAPGEVYSHRVVAFVGDGVQTRGDINGAPDGWVVHRSDLIGRAVAVLPGVGWMVRALPIVVAGCMVTVVLTRWRPGTRRRMARLLGGSLSVALAAAWLHPFAGIVLLQTAMSGTTAVATIVATGLLPVRASTSTGQSITLTPGEVATLRIPHTLPGHRVEIASTLALDWWGWIALILVSATPLLLSIALLVRARARRPA